MQYCMYFNLFKTKTLAIFVDVDLFEKRALVYLKIIKGKQSYINTSFCAPYTASLCLYVRLTIICKLKLANVMIKYIIFLKYHSITCIYASFSRHSYEQNRKSAYLNREEFQNPKSVPLNNCGGKQVSLKEGVSCYKFGLNYVFLPNMKL